jgi:hypothetical protein
VLLGFPKKDMKMGKNAWWSVLGTTQLTNVISILTFFGMIGGGVLTVVHLPQSPPEQSNQAVDYRNYILIIVLIVLILVTLINVIFTYIMGKKYHIIKILCELQNKYILTPDFKTAADHGVSSKESALASQGDAKILTNSLNYDICYCGTIAYNIVAGAKYNYVIPETDRTINDLKSYIGELYNRLHDSLIAEPGANPAEISDRIAGVLEKNIEFWFFDKNVLCLYNFARFKQVGGQPFIQSWWYVNPIDYNEDSYMLSREIDDLDDQDQLNEVFNKLKKISKHVTGDDVYKNKLNLDDYVKRAK